MNEAYKCEECGVEMGQIEWEDYDGTCEPCQDINDEVEFKEREANLDEELLRGKQ